MANHTTAPNNWIARVPNQLTALRIILTPLFIVLLFSQGYLNKILALVVFIVASVTDAYDGLIARKFNVVSSWGKFLDPLADKILVLSAFIAFWYMDFFPLWMLILIVLRDVVITGLRLWMMSRDTTMETSMFGKSKTVAQVVGIYVILVFIVLHHWRLFRFLHPTLDWMANNYVLWGLMFIVTVLTVSSGIHYLHVNRAVIKQFLTS